MKTSIPKEKEDKNSFTYAFKQQILRAWQPVPTLTSTICLFLALGTFFLSIGIALITLSNSVTEISQQYDNQCLIVPGFCNVTIYFPSDITSTVYIYYQLENFYQNHRRYIKSRDNDQLLGSVLSVSDISTTCDPIIHNSDLGTNITSFGGVALDPNGPANPCGLVAKSVFNDSYAFYSSSNVKIPIIETGIAWPSDISNKFSLPPNASSIQWINVTNEHFIVWMRTAATPSFRKLWGSIPGGIKAGTYHFVVTNQYDVSKFSGTKYIVLSTANAFGGKNNFLSIAYLVVGSFCFLMAIVFLVKNQVSPNRFDKFKNK